MAGQDMSRVVVRNGPPPERKPFNVRDDAAFLAWEAAWSDFLGNVPASEPLEARRARESDEQHEADPEAKRRHAEALAYIAAYKGNFAFILNLRADKRWGTKWHRLSPKQVDAVLKCKALDEERAKPRVREETGRDLNVLPYGRTYAAVDNDSGGLTFLIIDRAPELDRFKQPSKWHGWVFVKQQQGPNEVRLGSQRPGETYVGQWANLIDKVLADPIAAVVRYGIELGVCGVCGKQLTNQESRENGIGPVCLAKLKGERDA